MIACERGHLAVAKLLAAADADIKHLHNPNPNTVFTPMLAAAAKGKTEVMQWLRGLGASFTCTDHPTQVTALHAAVCGQAPSSSVQWLLDNGCGPHTLTPLIAQPCTRLSL